MKLSYKCNWPRCENTKSKFVRRYDDKCRFCKLREVCREFAMNLWQRILLGYSIHLRYTVIVLQICGRKARFTG